VITLKEYIAEMARKSKLEPDTTHGPMDSQQLHDLIGKTKFNALTKHSFYKKHVGNYGVHSQIAHKVDVDKYGYPTVRSTSSFTFNHKGRKVRKMIQTHMAKDGGKVYQSHLYHNYDNERHEERYGGGPRWDYIESLHKDDND
jgi:hypothetical protein